MKTSDLRPAHNTLALTDLDPQRSPAFSPNLYRYLSVKGHFYKDGGLLQGVFKVRAGTRAAEYFGAGTLLLGFVDDGFFTGTRLTSALCEGGRAQSAAYPVSKGLEVVEGFWDSYLKLGRCAIDPDHQEHFLSDRFDEREHARTCRWCGHEQIKKVTPRIVYDTTWISNG